jgi:pimeloyl-ACP methyl ester carboxylesterase
VRRWHEADPRIHLVVTGLCYEEGYQDLMLRCGADRGVHYVSALPRADLHAAMLESTAVLNTSLSECSPNAILEAMDLGCPVVVRDIPGNTCLVEDGLTGLVFSSPAEFRLKVNRLVDDQRFARRLGGRGRHFVRGRHGAGQERAAYAAVFDRMRTELGIGAASRDRLSSVRGVDLSVETFGVPEDPAVLLIAGAGASMLAWDAEFCEKLVAEGRFVIRYDQRDTGRAVKYPLGAPDYTLRDLAADAVGVLDGLSIESAHVVGASMGGMVAQLAALDHPHRIASLTLISTSPGGPDLPAMSPRLGVALDDLDVPDWSDRAAVVNQLVSKQALLTASPAFDEAAARERAERVFDRADGQLAAADNHLVLDLGEPWRLRLGTLTTPTLVVHGGADPMFPIAHAHALAGEIPGAELLVLDRAGHEPTAVDRVAVAAALLRHTAQL